MRFTNYIIFSFLAVLIYCTVESSALRCFHCHSHHNAECGDPFEQNYNGSSLLVDCDSLGGGHNYTFCRKTVQTATLRPDEVVRVIRSCGFLEEPKLDLDEGDDPKALQCYRRSGTFAVDVQYCACYADGCNSANWIGSGGVLNLILFSAFLSILHYKYL